MKTKKKHELERILAPFAFNINPNFITFLAIVSTFASAYLIVKGYLIYAAALFLLGGLLDVLDGLIARKYKRTTKFGAFFDRVADRINDSVILIAITYAGYVEGLAGIATLVLVLLASYISATIEVISKTKVGEALSMRSIRVFVLFAGIIAAYFNPIYLYYTMYVILAIASFSILIRFQKAYQVLK